MMVKEALQEFSQELLKMAKKQEEETEQKCAQIILARTGLARLQEKIASELTDKRG